MKTYSALHRNKWLTSSATSINDMIAVYQETIEYLQEIQLAGLEVDFSSAGDDYIYFRTQDPKLADKFDLEEEEDENWDNDEESIDEDRLEIEENLREERIDKYTDYSIK